MDWYHLALFVHIVGAFGIFMALAVELAALLGSRAARTVEVLRAWSSVGKPLAVLFPVCSLLILAAGLAMTIGVWGWTHAWIDLSLAMLVFMSAWGAIVNGRFAEQIARQAALLGSGPIPPELARMLNNPLHWTSVAAMFTGSLGVVFLMTTKPGWLGSIVALIIAFVLGAVLAQVLLRSAPTVVLEQPAKRTDERADKVSARA